MEEIEEETELNRCMLDNAALGICRADKDGAILAVNDYLVALLGYSREELCSMTCFDIDPALTPELWQQHREQLIADGSHIFETLHLCKDGSAIPVEVTVIFLQCEGDTFSCAFVRDINGRKQADNELRFAQFVIDKAFDQTFWVTPDGHFTYVNEATCAALGYGRKELLGMTVADIDPLWPAKDWPRHWEELKKNGTLQFESRHRARNGRVYPVEIRANYIEFGGKEYNCAFVSDISRRKRAEEELRRTNEMFSAIIEAAPLPITAINPAGRVLMWNRAAERVFGWRAEEVLDRVLPIVPEDERSGFFEKNRKVFAGKTSGGLQVRRRRKDGTLLDMQLFDAPLHDSNKNIYAVVGILMDVTEQKKSQEQIAYLAHHDQLTGLPNRALLADRFERATARAGRTGNRLALCAIDLDGFKYVNDMLGHHHGDKLLCTVAEWLRKSVRSTDTVCRMGGDEFIILFDEIKEMNVLSGLVRRVAEVFSNPRLFEGFPQPITMSMGVAVFPEDGSDYETLFKNADAAMYFAKESGRNNVQFFRREISLRIGRRLTIERGLRRALAEEELTVYFQPICRVEDNRIVGAEALVRWQHPEEGWVSPGDFIPVAEETGLILPLGQWVLEEVCRTIRGWDERGLPALTVAVNVSAIQIFQEGFGALVLHTLERYGVEPHRLELEVTESLFLKDLLSVESVMRQLKEIGVGLALDDFGTGYSSLSYLKRFHIDKLKVDRAFVADVCRDEQDAALTDTIIMMARSLGMKSVAEGVESVDQLDYLRSSGCDYYQGFLCSRPVAGETFVEML